jgi:phenylalanyl-tRNA synthetase alpha chain
MRHFQPARAALWPHLAPPSTGTRHLFPATIENSNLMPDQSIRDLETRSLARIESAQTPEELEAVRVEALGRKGALAQVSKEMGKLAPNEKSRIGKLLNAAKQALETALDTRKLQFDEAALRARLDAEWIDLTLPAEGPRRGHLHPITRIQRELEDLFMSLGFAVLDGPEVETEYHNFDALNIPADHPARDMQDTFWLDGGNLLRTHTSPVQVRGMERLGPPLRMIAPGRVFRNESVDASHEHTFYQLEGMMVDRDVSVAHLLYFMKTLLTAIFKREVTVRLRPGYFPFVEPGFELDIQCLICGGPGCPVCKQSGWVELLPCGLVNPNVLHMSGIDPEHWGGFAFGLGLTRLVMMRYGIDDIRHLQGGDLRFLEQF